MTNRRGRREEQPEEEAPDYPVGDTGYRPVEPSEIDTSGQEHGKPLGAPLEIPTPPEIAEAVSEKSAETGEPEAAPSESTEGEERQPEE